MNTRPVMPSVTEAARRVDASEDRIAVSDEILSVTEDFVAYVAERGFGITVATPARRKLRDQIERIVLEFLRTAEPPAALDKRAEARVEEIVRQALETIRSETVVGQDPEPGSTAEPPAPPPDRLFEGSR